MVGGAVLDFHWLANTSSCYLAGVEVAWHGTALSVC